MGKQAKKAVWILMALPVLYGSALAQGPIQPNGGEVVETGGATKISWTAMTTLPLVDLYYSVDGGQTYVLIATGEANDGTYDWTVVKGIVTPSVAARVKVVAYDGLGNSAADASHADFTIEDPQVTLLQPNGGETIGKGTTTKIAWTTDDNLSGASVDLSMIIPGGRVLYGSAYPSGGPATFYAIDPATGVATAIGAIGFNRVGAMAFDRVTHTIYAAGVRPSGGVNVLITIDPGTGAGTEVGPTGVPFNNVSDLAFRPSDNTLFAETRHNGSVCSVLYTIDVTTGAATLVGIANIGCPGGNAIEFDASNTLYLGTGFSSFGHELFTLDQTTGAATALRPLNYPPLLSSNSPRPQAMKFDPTTGLLLATVHQNGGGGPGDPTYLATIDIATGNVSVIGQTTDDMDGLVVAGTPPVTLPIATGLPNTGTYAWTVPTIPTTHGVRIQVTTNDTLGGTKSNFSDAGFTIEDAVPPVAHLDSPNGGETIAKGTTTKIAWTASDNVAVTGVDLYYSVDGGASYTPIALNQANDGSYDWAVPVIATTHLVRVRVVARDASGNSAEDASDADFTIEDAVSPSVTVFSPNGGETVNKGRDFTIQWSATDNVGVTTVDLYYAVDGGTVYTPIATNEANDGAYDWLVPATLTTQGRVKVVAHDTSGNNGEDASDSDFTIIDRTPPVVRVDSPNGGEVVRTDGTTKIAWTATDNLDVASVDLYYSVDGGQTYVLIAAGEANDGTYDWMVVKRIVTPTVAARVKVVAYDGSGNSAADASDADFTIEDPQLTLLQPNGGETIGKGTTTKIAWTTDGNLLGASIDLSMIIPGSRAVYGSAYSGPSGPATFYEIDRTTGAATAIGPIGFNRVGAMAYHPGDNTIYALAGSDNGNNEVLITIDPNTGAGTAIGPTGTSGRGNFSDMAFRPSDHVLFARRFNFNAGCDTRIFTIDIATGFATLLGSGGTPCEGGNGLEFDASNVLYQAPQSSLWTIDQTTGAGTFLRPLIYPPAYGGGARVDAMKFDPSTGVLLATVHLSFGGGSTNLASIDFATGLVTDIGPTAFGMDGLVVAGTPPVTTPIASGQPNTGTYAWTVPLIPTTHGVRIQVTTNDGAGGTKSNFSDASFTIEDAVPPLAHLDSPNGGETIAKGTTTKIAWTASDNVGVTTVDLYYSLDGGASYTPIASHLANSGTYDWAVPTLATTHTVRVKVVARDASGNSAEDASDADFTIEDAVSPSVTVFSPNGGETVNKGRDFTIQWSASDNVGVTSVDLYYSVDGGINYTPIATNEANDGAYDWFVPATLTTQGRVKVVAHDASGNDGEDASDFDFIIIDRTLPVVHVDSPNGGEVANKSTEFKIAWTATDNLAVASVDLAYSADPDSGTTVYGSAYSGQSDPATFYEIDRTTGAATAIGPIGFNRVGAMAYHPGNNTIYALAGSSSNNNEVLITIDPNTGAGTLIGSTGTGGSGNFSDMAFRPSDNVLFARRFNFNPGCDTRIFTIDLATGLATLVGSAGTPCQGGNGLEFDASDVLYTAPQTGLWTIDQNTGAGTFLRPLIYPPTLNGGRVDAMKFDRSTGLLLAMVNRGSRNLASIDLATGAVTDIGPTASGMDGLVVTGSPPPFISIASGLPNSGTYVWTVPSTPTSHALVKVTAYDAAGNRGFDLSDAEFTIISAPLVHLDSPNGAETIAKGGLTKVAWTATESPKTHAAITDVDLYYSLDSGTNYTLIAMGEANDGTYDWPVPVIATTHTVRVKVAAHDAGGNTTEDASDTDFTIEDATNPVVTVLSPNGSGKFVFGTTYKLSWTVTDNVAVDHVDLCLSRDNGTTYEVIAAGLPGDGGGTYLWEATEPAATRALFKVKAKDTSGNEGSDASDDVFEISSGPTSVLLLLFQAEPASEGIELRWRFSESKQIAAVVVERSMSEAGPWNAVEAVSHTEGSVTVALDWHAETGKTYYYRLVVELTGGGTQVFGPLAGTAGVNPAEFALVKVAPNPSAGATGVDFTVARLAKVRLSVADIQGREVAVLANGEYGPGRYQATWSGQTGHGPAPVGLYFVRYQVPGKTFSRRIVLSR